MNLDVDASNRARAVHRVVRALHDGACPECGYIGPAEQFAGDDGDTCPQCDFHISATRARRAMQLFASEMAQSLDVFYDWVASNCPVTRTEWSQADR